MILASQTGLAFTWNPAGFRSTGAGTKALSIRLIAEPETLDWNRAHTPIETHLLMNLMEGLVTLGPDLKTQPALAESWTVSKDGLTYQFKLRPGVKWSDGKPLRAADFVYSWKRLLTPSTGAVYAYFLFDLVGAKAFYEGNTKDFNQVGVHALDDQTLQVKLTRPVAHWINIPSFWVTFPMRQDLVEKFPSEWTIPSRLVTLGPFLLSAHELESRIELKRNSQYYGEPAKLDQVNALVVSDDSTALNLYEAGKIDFLTDIADINLKKLAGRPDLKIFPYLKTVYLGMVIRPKGKGTSLPPTSNVHFRKAIGLALNKAKIQELIHSNPVSAESFIAPPLAGSEKGNGLPYDPVQAKKEFDESGWDACQSPVELLSANWERSLTVAQWLQAELKEKLGLNVILQPSENKIYRTLLDERKSALFLASWSADFPDADNFLSVFQSDSGNNRTGWESPEFNAKTLRARAAQDPVQRVELYAELQRLLLKDDVVIVPLYHESNMALVRPNVKYLELNPVNYLMLKKVELDPFTHSNTQANTQSK